MARGLEFNWSEADLVVHPVQAIAAYSTPQGLILRQQRRSERERDDVITIPHHAVNLLIRRLQQFQNTSVISMEEVGNSELVEIFAAE